MNLIFMKELRLITWEVMARFPHKAQPAHPVSEPLQDQLLKGFSWGGCSNPERNTLPMFPGITDIPRPVLKASLGCMPVGRQCKCRRWPIIWSNNDSNSWSNIKKLIYGPTDSILSFISLLGKKGNGRMLRATLKNMLWMTYKIENFFRVLKKNTPNLTLVVTFSKGPQSFSSIYIYIIKSYVCVTWCVQTLLYG